MTDGDEYIVIWDPDFVPSKVAEVRIFNICNIVWTAFH